MPDDIFDAAVRLVMAMGLQGLCGVEFRRNASNQPLLMEIDARLAGRIETALVSGADFPLMTWQWATGQRVEQPAGYQTGVRMRWLRGDMRWLRDNHRRPGRPDSLSRGRALCTFAAEFARLPRYDCWDRRDLRPGPGRGAATHRGGHPQQQAEPAATGNRVPPEGGSPCQLTRS